MRTLISILWISFFPLAAAAQGDDLSYRLKKVIKDKKAEIGIAVILDAQDTVTVNNDDRYPSPTRTVPFGRNFPKAKSRFQSAVCWSTACS